MIVKYLDLLKDRRQNLSDLASEFHLHIVKTITSEKYSRRKVAKTLTISGKPALNGADIIKTKQLTKIGNL